MYIYMYIYTYKCTYIYIYCGSIGGVSWMISKKDPIGIMVAGERGGKRGQGERHSRLVDLCTFLWSSGTEI
jgi:hypothetical protein